ncbi:MULTISPECIES: helix-turn-helix domain-containing protein [Dietzia]|uniref:Helix-turn-helix domain-containing protein n=2 Tax=Bacteria TaxID=2 RepID=A0ABT8H1V4_9ACTN|nr:MULTISPECIES: helix-turn-helix domain-containing protein [Dietzia]MCZ4539445.1 transcriptional regulator [Dietzia maris]MCZ4656090.1 transcriptional regulator [Dietzia kunjamensis]MDJ0422665.1 helix-turn-helix domain-containing protein [Dietzia kunjamensis]MDN4506449.1 helix-turn-helix domain-containing protein [Dietzia maris]MDV3354581.1 helix-turn-helix domain-containing protein [Dietzia sp. IN118]
MTQTVRPSSPAPGEDHIDLSWRRSASCGLTPKSARPGAPDPRASRSHRLAEAARPVMDDLDEVLKDTGAMLLLADREGRVIRSVRDNARISRMLLRRGVDDGATLTEDAVGNNGIGTALETRAGVFIHGEQHFAEVLRDFACYGHPIIDPLTRRLVGAVDLTGMSADASRMFAPFVRKIVADIEARYVDTARADDRELWHRFVERTRTSDTATCAFGDEVVLASHSSLERLDSRDLGRLRRLVDRDELGDSVELSVGTVGVLSSRVGRRGHLLDLVFPDQQHPAVPVLGSTRPASTAAMAASTPGRSAMPAASTPGSSSGATGRAHAVVGPSGSGRSTTARDIAGPGALHVRLAEADSADAAWIGLVVPALRDQGDQGRPLVLDDIDLLDDADLRRLAARLRSAEAALVVVTSREDPRAAVTEALDACGTRTVLRPLHERGAESAEIVARMVTELTAEKGLGPTVPTARFTDAVCALDLPNGLISLRSILSECLTESGHRGSTTLDVDSLPSRARTGRPPRAGELARGEYDAIVAALAECDGVRSRAAKRLGISRTTLYARMREFGLS